MVSNDTSAYINNTQTATFSVGDVLYPNVTLESPADGASYNVSQLVTVRVNVTDNVNVSLVMMNVSLPNGTVDRQSMVLTSNNLTYQQNLSSTTGIGSYTITLVANDTQNNVNDTVSITVDVGDSVYPVIVNVTPVNDTIYDIGANVLITANVTDNVNVSVVLVNVTLPDLTMQQIALSDADEDDIYNGTLTSTVQNGAYSLLVIANDTAGKTVTAAADFVVGDLTVPGVVVDSPANMTNVSADNIEVRLTVTDNNDTAINCTLFVDGVLDGSNTSVQNSSVASFNITDIAEGRHLWYVVCNDDNSNVNTTETRAFNVDTSVADFISLTTDPTLEDDLDPNSNITVMTNVTDNFTAVDNVILQYKISNATDYTNLTMMESEGLWNATFNATSNGTYNLRLVARDIVDNVDTSSVVNITVEYDRTWLRSPATFTPQSGAFGVNITLGNLTINNTGDYTMNFTVASSSSETVFNDTTTFSLAAGETRTFKVNDTTTVVGVKSITITANATGGDPASQTTSGAAIVASGQPILYATFLTPVTDTMTAERGDTSVPFVYKIENVGEGNATNITLFTTLPQDWELTYGSLNTSIELLAPGESEDNSIEIDIPTNAAYGTLYMIINSTGFNTTGYSLRDAGLVFGNRITVTISDPTTVGSSGSGSSTTTTTTTASSTSTGGGGSTREAILEEFIDTVLSGREVLSSSETFHLVRGQSSSFPVEIRNIFSGTIMQDVSIHISGFLSQYLSVNPENIRSIPANMAQSFNVSIISPEYMEVGKHTLVISIRGKIKGDGIDKDFYETRDVTLVIHSVTKEEASESISAIGQILAEMGSSNFNTEKIDRMLLEAESALSNDEYEEVVRIYEKIKLMKENAFEANDMILHVESKVKAKSSITGAYLGTANNLKETENLLRLAKAAFARGDFAIALKRVKEAKLTMAFESNEFDLLSFIIDNFWMLMAVFLLTGTSGIFSFRYYKTMTITQKIRDVEKAEKTTRKLMEELQERQYKKMDLGVGTFHNRMDNYRKRLSVLAKERVSLRHKRVNLLDSVSLIHDLKDERKEIIGSIKKMQHNYFISQKVSKNEYEDQLRVFHERLAEIENEQLTMEMKLIHKRGRR